MVSEAIAQFKIRVEAIEGYRLWLKGGRKRQDWLVAEHRSKFWVKLEPREVEYTSDYSASTGTSDDSLSDDSGQAPGPGPPDLFFSGPAVDTEAEVNGSSGAAPSAPSDPPSAGGGTSHCILCSFSGRAVLDCERQDTAMWNFANGQDALAQGNQGDTSGCVCGEGSQAVLSAAKKYRFPIKLGPCARLWLFGMTFLTQLRALQAVKGPDDYLVPNTFAGDFLVGKDLRLSACPGEHFPLDTEFGRSESMFHIGVLVTLLEEAKDDGFLIVCQFVSDLWVAALGQGANGQGPYLLSLEDAIPRTAFQTAVKELQDLLPERLLIRPDQWQDWLDCDLRALLFGNGFPNLDRGMMLLSIRKSYMCTLMVLHVRTRTAMHSLYHGPSMSGLSRPLNKPILDMPLVQQRTRAPLFILGNVLRMH